MAVIYFIILVLTILRKKKYQKNKTYTHYSNTQKDTSKMLRERTAKAKTFIN